MVRKAILAVSMLLVAAGAAAETKIAPPFALAPEPPGDRQVERDLLLWQAPLQAATSPDDAWVDVEVEIYGDGELLHREALTVRRPEPGKVGVVEVLGRDADQRRVLRGMAERGRVDLEARFLVDGAEVERLPVAELTRPPRVERGERAEYLAVRYPEPGVLTADDLRRITAADVECDCTARNACFGQCQDDYQACIDSGTCFPQIICEECENQLAACQQSCPSCVCTCTEPKSVSTRYETYLVDFYPTGWSQCYESIWESDFQQGYWHDEWAWVYREDEIQVTEHCDGSKTEQVVGSTYFYFFCYQESFFTCSFPFSWPPSTC
ncbi:MAG TPA: hypothetical protein VHM02_04520 [Thermoanaerobaculia bacterium]|nr:hypothetical protein [Thermoanaerobaculia bacterium]